MASFEIDPDFRQQLDWIRHFVAEELEPIDLAFGAEEVIYDKTHPVHDAVIRPLQQRVREQGLWSCHLTPEFGGQGVRAGAFGVHERDPWPVGLCPDCLWFASARFG